MLTPIKSWKTFEEQADILKQRGLLFANRARLENYLSRIGYYRFSGYLHPFRQWDSHNNLLLDTFMPNSHFEDVLSEPPRDCRRLNILREYDNENTKLHS